MHTTAAELAGIQAEIEHQRLNPFLIQNDMVLVLLLVYSYCDASSCQSIVGLSQSLLFICEIQTSYTAHFDMQCHSVDICILTNIVLQEHECNATEIVDSFIVFSRGLRMCVNVVTI